ncbi:cyclic nucleotide-binding domain-containing protein [Nannocystis sp. RBIL2]|uniref:cyclic nucleotide-binding domain-containing protein n=1 Tax=Nannocystis sp. RBIL2 TaxID=2996788 RepID=UPI003208C704
MRLLAGRAPARRGRGGGHWDDGRAGPGRPAPRADGGLPRGGAADPARARERQRCRQPRRRRRRRVLAGVHAHLPVVDADVGPDARGGDGAAADAEPEVLQRDRARRAEVDPLARAVADHDVRAAAAGAGDRRPVAQRGQHPVRRRRGGDRRLARAAQPAHADRPHHVPAQDQPVQRGADGRAAAIAEACHEVAFAPLQAVFEQGAPGDALCILLEGTVEVVRDGAVINRLKPGDVCGEVAVLSQSARTAGVFATEEPVRALMLGADRFRKIVRESGDIGLAVIEVLSERLRVATEREAALRSLAKTILAKKVDLALP